MASISDGVKPSSPDDRLIMRGSACQSHFAMKESVRRNAVRKLPGTDQG